MRREAERIEGNRAAHHAKHGALQRHLKAMQKAGEIEAVRARPLASARRWLPAKPPRKGGDP